METRYRVSQVLFDCEEGSASAPVQFHPDIPEPRARCWCGTAVDGDEMPGHRSLLGPKAPPGCPGRRMRRLPRR